MIEHPSVCRQIERFPDLLIKNEILIDFPRVEVLLPVFGRPSDLDIFCTQYRIINLILYLGLIPNASHYQGYILTNGNI